jgi:hypothetical protein
MKRKIFYKRWIVLSLKAMPDQSPKVQALGGEAAFPTR